MRRKPNLSFLLLILVGYECEAAPKKPLVPINAPPKTTLWDVEMSGVLYRWHGDRDNDVFGRGGILSFGYGQTIDSSWWWQGRFDVYAGPWEVIRNHTFDSDFNGTGISAGMGRALWPGSLRDPGGCLAGILSIGYVDMAGKSSGQNHAQSTKVDDGANFYLEQSYRIGVNALWVAPEISWVHMEPSRPQGNLPELLDTRIEGYSVSAALMIPIFSTYHADMVRRAQGDANDQKPREFRESGSLKGYAASLTLRTWLGT